MQKSYGTGCLVGKPDIHRISRNLLVKYSGIGELQSDIPFFILLCSCTLVSFLFFRQNTFCLHYNFNLWFAHEQLMLRRVLASWQSIKPCCYKVIRRFIFMSDNNPRSSGWLGPWCLLVGVILLVTGLFLLSVVLNWFPGELVFSHRRGYHSALCDSVLPPQVLCRGAVCHWCFLAPWFGHFSMPGSTSGRWFPV